MMGGLSEAIGNRRKTRPLTLTTLVPSEADTKKKGK